MKRWQLQEAKQRLSEVVNEAISRGPQAVTRHGKPVAVVVAWPEWNRKAQNGGSLADWLARCPRTGLSDRDVDRLFRRSRDKGRKIALS
jgi:prevent-host-death family protein